MTIKVLKSPSQDNKQIQEYVAAARRGLSGQFVVKTEKGWQVKRVGAQKASGVFAIKADAVKHAIGIAKNQKTEVYIFDDNGRLVDRKPF